MIRAAGLEGPDAPQPGRRTDLLQPGGGTRHVGLPTGLDRCTEHARRPVLQEEWDLTCAERSDGFRPPRSAHQAGGQAQASSREGDTGVVAMDLEPCVDRVHHAVLLRRVRRRVTDRRGGSVIHRWLKAGVVPLEGSVEPTAAGTPPGGPRSPLLTTLLVDEFDTALETRGHRFVRDADEANRSGRSRPAGERVMARVRRVRKRPRRRTGQAAKSAVDRPWTGTCLDCTCTTRQAPRRNGREKALKAFQAKVRALTGRTRGRTMRQSGPARRQRRLGGWAFFGVAEVRSPRRDRDQWSRRRRRDPWMPWGRRGSRERRQGGGDRPWAWNTVTSAHGPWRLR
jgi:RNA-directed DNA polymerase